MQLVFLTVWPHYTVAAVLAVCPMVLTSQKWLIHPVTEPVASPGFSLGSLTLQCGKTSALISSKSKASSMASVSLFQFQAWYTVPSLHYCPLKYSKALSPLWLLNITKFTCQHEYQLWSCPGPHSMCWPWGKISQFCFFLNFYCFIADFTPFISIPPLPLPPCICPPPLQHLPENKAKFKRKAKTQTKQNKAKTPKQQ